ncbi:TBC1 domain family member 30 [Schistosoma japonicum]|nr:TBC1 domain family member 30 [Schistosoma japonicum]
MEMSFQVKQENNSRMKSHQSKRSSQQRKLNDKYSTRSNNGLRGRRGPALYRPAVNKTSLEQSSISLNPLHRRLSNFKPSLTPGLGTRRVISVNPRQDANLKFTMEPRLSDEAFAEWINAVRRMARIGDGLPSAIRSRVWSTVADRQLAKQHVDWDHEIKMAFNEPSNQDDDRLGEQIVKDLHRTGCEQFESDSDRASLKRVLLAYARWNKRVGYCQGFNVIAAAVLDVTARDEKKAFKIMVYLIDYVLPESYFAQNLQALSVDIAVFRQLLQNRIPELANHLDHLQCKAAMETDCQLTGKQLLVHKDILSKRNHGAYEPPLMNVYIIQWFLTLFATCLASDAVLRVWDSILLEGSEVILRTAIVIMDFLKSRLLKLKSADQFYATMTDLIVSLSEGRIVSSQELLFEIYELAPFPYPGLKELREKFMYNISPLVLPKNLMNISNNNVNERSVQQHEYEKKMGKFNFLKYFPSNFKTSKVLQSNDNHMKSLTKFKNKKYLDEATESCNTIKARNSIREKGQYDINDSHSLPSSDKTILPTPELSENESMSDHYQEISLTTDDMNSQIGKLSRKHTRNFDDSMNARSNNNNSKGINNKLTNKFPNVQLKETVKCFSAFWPNKANDNQNVIYSHRSCITESTSMKSLRYSVTDNLPVNVFRLRSLQSSVVKDDEVKAKSDISQIGPGAVSDTPDLAPIRKTSSADLARMTRNLEKLKSHYKKQQARQRSTVIILPTDILKSTCHQMNMIAILPQKRHASTISSFNRISFTKNHYPIKSISLDSYDTLENCSDNNLNEIDDNDNENNHTTTSDVLNNEMNNSLTNNNNHYAKCTNPTLIGTVQSWQENSDWSIFIDEIDDSNMKNISNDLNCKQLSINKQTNNRKVKLCELASNNGMEICLPMKYSYSDQTLNGFTTTNNHVYHTDHQVNSTIQSPIHCKNIYDTNIIYSKTNINELILMNMIKQFNQLKEVNCLHNSKESKITSTQTPTLLSDESGSLNDVETSSCYTSVSRSILPKKLPWQEAAYSFAVTSRLNKLHTSNRTYEVFPVKTSLTQSRKEFGAKFGIY